MIFLDIAIFMLIQLFFCDSDDLAKHLLVFDVCYSKNKDF